MYDFFNVRKNNHASYYYNLFKFKSILITIIKE